MAIEKSAGAFAAPPAGAPREVSSGDIAPTASQIAAAQANARELAPLAPSLPTMTDEVIAAAIGKTVEDVQRIRAEEQTRSARGNDPVPVTTTDAPAVTSSFKGADIPLVKAPRGDQRTVSGLRRAGSLRRVGNAVATAVADAAKTVVDAMAGRPAVDADAGVVAIPADAQEEAGGVASTDVSSVATAPDPAPVVEALASHAPAFSNTESPARGVPKPIADRGKQITGGFGPAGDASYYPLDGLELRQAIEALLGDLQRRIQDDLRFSIAVVYPRVTARVVIEVQAYAQDGFQIPKVFVAGPDRKGSTPIEIARQHGDEIVFCVVSEIQEMTDAGESVAPPNAIREELGIEVPMKQWVGGGIGSNGRSLVDRTQV